MKILFLSSFAFLISCQTQKENKQAISKDEMRKIVTQLDLQFSQGVKTKDSILLANIWCRLKQQYESIRYFESVDHFGWKEFRACASIPSGSHFQNLESTIENFSSD